VLPGLLPGPGLRQPGGETGGPGGADQKGGCLRAVFVFRAVFGFLFSVFCERQNLGHAKLGARIKKGGL